MASSLVDIFSQHLRAMLGGGGPAPEGLVFVADEEEAQSSAGEEEEQVVGTASSQAPTRRRASELYTLFQCLGKTNPKSTTNQRKTKLCIACRDNLGSRAVAITNMTPEKARDHVRNCVYITDETRALFDLPPRGHTT
jgi:hypothetical protein